MGRKKAREGAMKTLYQMEIREEFDMAILDLYLSINDYNAGESKYMLESLDSLLENIDTIDTYISNNIHGWTIDRLSKVDLSILRIAVYEIFYRKDIPIEVSINEAIEIAKKYSTEDAFRFINGVLGGIVKEAEKEGYDL